MNVEDVVAERIEQARRRIQRQKADRARRQKLRAAGKARAHALRAAQWAAAEKQNGDTTRDR